MIVGELRHRVHVRLEPSPAANARQKRWFKPTYAVAPTLSLCPECGGKLSDYRTRPDGVQHRQEMRRCRACGQTYSIEVSDEERVKS